MFGLETQLQKLPDAPGIYLFYNASKELIYVGKATSLRSRVRSYFRGARTSRPIEQMIHEVVNIKTIITDSVLEAIILEGKYIKEKQPKYNVDWKDDKSWNYLALTNDVFPKLVTIRERELNNKQFNNLASQQFVHVFGPFPGLKTAEVLKILRRIFKYSTCAPNKNNKPCFYHQIGECFGVCVGEITPKDYQQKVVRPLVLFLSGKKQVLMRQLNSKMANASRQHNFEEAARLRDQIFSLQKIQDVALLNKDFFRFNTKANFLTNIKIEGYDISNLGKTDKVGALVVFKDGLPAKNEYRKFNIKTVIGQSDVDCLAEVLNRRLNHEDWSLPDYFLIDGGAPQVNTVQNILRLRRINRPVIGIAKGAERKRNDFIFDHSNKNVVEFIRTHQNIFIAVRDEAHRFAISFNRSKRVIK